MSNNNNNNSNVTVATLQYACSTDPDFNFATACTLISAAASSKGANVISLQEMPLLPVFSKDPQPILFGLATTIDENRHLREFQKVAKDLHVVIPFSFFEKRNNSCFCTTVVIDATGEIVGEYRKAHLSDEVGARDKFFFTPGDTGFPVFDTIFGKIGILFTHDCWFPEACRKLALQGAEMILVLGSLGVSTPKTAKGAARYQQWLRVVQGQSAANMIPFVVSNRIGTEVGACCTIEYCGGGFVTDETGTVVASVEGTEAPSYAVAVLDLAKMQKDRITSGLFRDRRPDIY